MVPAHLVLSTLSLKNIRARTRVNNGIVKFSVVTTAIGARESPSQYKAIPAASKKLRAMCSVTRSVLNEFNPDANITGSIVRVAKAKRKKTT
jgi:hypothetical protein